MAKHGNNWKLTHTDKTGYGHQIRHYKVDDYIVTLENCNGVFHIVDSNFDLCDIKNETSKNIGALFRKINTLFI